MVRRSRLECVRLLLIGLTFLGGLAPLLAWADPLQLGAAKLDLTPPPRVPLAGYSRRRGQPSRGSHDPLSVRALVLQQGEATVALVSCDLLIIDERLAQAVQHRLDALRRDAPVQLLVAATHTHSGPGAYGQKFLEKLSMGHFDQAVFDFLVAQIAQAVVRAAASLQPVAVQYAVVPTTGLLINRMDPSGAIDPELTCIVFYDSRQRPIAVVTSFNAHPTTLGAWNRQLSADYPGVFSRVVEQRYPEALCLFFAGAVGDQAPVKQGEGFESTEWLGQQLAHRALAVMPSPTPQGVQTLKVEQRVVPLPPARLRLGRWRLPSWLGQAFVDDDATLTVLAIGSVRMMGFPCDLSAELGLQLKGHARAIGLEPVLVGFANDYIGYCLPERLYETRTYESTMAFNGPTTGALLVEQLKRMMDDSRVSKIP